ncbi:hypothetical protein GCM10011352_03280 [Marinobacterium zhoushanense]|uniref:HEAT repeat protein n=1 Tax=Marinobacterium zhoushanense TaxID=1679163 RepID=A0ABQ1K0Y1_9GAMM|nr:hypothetical protein [Marinobacterium zhoushanense]GGB80917.1 hypothetical protein GCM10011352_03280 [Marinobacterium zhoushanense]
MTRIKLILTLVAVCLAQSAAAFQTNEERIANYVSLLGSNNYDQQQKMLSRLQWSGLSDPALYDVIEQRLLAHQQTDDRALAGLMAHHARALGYSGNEKYRPTLALVSEQASDSKLRSHAKRALGDLSAFSGWWALLPGQPTPAPGQSIESATYMQMLNTDNVFVQRLAARAIFHERIADAGLLKRSAELIQEKYLDVGMDGETEDTIAWLCKAIGQNAAAQYRSFLADVAEKSPSRKVAKYARSYVQ